jgi:radical SAM protein with 4Fe4S-binding SPASM domain
LAIEKRPEVIIEVLKFRDRDDSLDISGDFKNYFKGASFNSYFASSWRGTLEDEQLSEETSGKPEICSLPLNDMAIGYDGVVKCCTIDYNSDCPLGDLNDELIMDVWLGDRRSDFLKRICNKDYKNIKTCKKCTAPYYAHKKERLRERNCSGE